MAEEEKTSIQVSIALREWLIAKGTKNESYEDVLRRLLADQFPELAPKVEAK